jgi:hypothetical protein
MELKDFIKNAISSISQGIIEVSEELKDKGVIVNPEYTVLKNDAKSIDSSGFRYIEELYFEVHVGVDEENSDGIKGNATVGLKVLFGASIEGSNESKSTLSNTNILKFKIPVAFPYSPIPEGYKKPVRHFDSPALVTNKQHERNRG